MMAKYNVGDKVRILDVDAIDFGDRHYYNGMETEVVELFLGEFPKLRNKFGMRGISILGNEYHAIERITEYTPTKPKKSERITALETQVAELQAKVEALEKAGKYPLTAQFELQNAEVDAILADIKRKAKPTLEALLDTYPTANEQRADVIKRAKAFVTKRTTYAEFDLNATVHFVVNSEKRTVVALLNRGFKSYMIEKAIAKCDPDDVFNADIGKAIALARALGVEVPEEFVKAVQPTEVVVGHRVQTLIYGDTQYNVTEIHEGEARVDNTARYYGVDRIDIAFKVVEDTDAVYE